MRYPLDRFLSGGESYPTVELPGPEKSANILRNERDRISTINFETAQLHILSDVLVAVAVVVA